MSSFAITVPGKTIIAGEHAVVYGYPALVAAVDRRLEFLVEFSENKKRLPIVADLLENIASYRADTLLKKLQEQQDDVFRISVKSSIPIGSGLGSSAALAVGLVRVLLELAGQYESLEQVNALAFQVEKNMHMNASGVDNTIVTFGGVQRYQRQDGKVLLDPITPKFPLDSFWLLQSGKPSESTGDMVQMVAAKKTAEPQKYERIFQEIGELVESWIREPGTSKKIIDRIRRNQELLAELGVVSDTTRRLVAEVEALGGAAKISGAGGVKTGSGILLVYHPQTSVVQSFAEQKKLEAFPVQLSLTGLQFEQH